MPVPTSSAILPETRQGDNRLKKPRLLLGVDGGGSKTAAWIASLDAQRNIRVLGKGLGGPTNLRAAGLRAAGLRTAGLSTAGSEQALANLDKAVNKAFQAAELDPKTVDSAVLAMAGSALPDVQALLNLWAKNRQLATHLKIVHDALPILHAGTPDGWGVALIAGTGSAVIGIDPRGESHTVGGWGNWFGDEGSGFALGRGALAAVAKAVDQTGPETALVALVLEKLQVTEARLILQIMSAAGDVRPQIAALAPLVLEASERMDLVASGIVDQAVAELASLVSAAVDKLSLPDPFPLALAGGVACGSGAFRESLQNRFEKIQLHPSPLTTVDNPVEGCLIIARAELFME